MSDSTSLTCCAATSYSYNYVELVSCLCSYERLSNDNLECLKSEILIDRSLVDCNISISGYKLNSCD